MRGADRALGVGELAVERQHVEFPGQYHETFYARRPGGVARRHFSYSKDKPVIGYDIEWNGDAISLVRYRTADGRTGVQYERIDRDALAQRRDEIVSTITRAILAAIATEAPDAHVYAIALWSCDAEYQHRFPPNVAFATESIAIGSALPARQLPATRLAAFEKRGWL